MQKRFFNSGATVEAEKFRNLLQNIAIPQILRGGTFLPSGTNDLSISPVSVIFPDGVLMEETEEKILSLVDGVDPIINSSARNYTVYYTHVDENLVGGTAAELFLTKGPGGGAGTFLSSVADGVILGWIKYPGGSVPLDSTMFYYPPRTQLAPLDSKCTEQAYLAPFPIPGSGILWSSNTNTNADGNDANGLYSSLTGPGASTILFAFKGRPNPPAGLFIDLQLSGSGSSVAVSVFDDTNTLIQFSDSTTTKTFSGTTSFSSNFIKFKTGTFADGKNFKVRLVVTNVGGGDVAKLYSLGITQYDKPF